MIILYGQNQEDVSVPGAGLTLLGQGLVPGVTRGLPWALGLFELCPGPAQHGLGTAQQRGGQVCAGRAERSRWPRVPAGPVFIYAHHFLPQAPNFSPASQPFSQT